LNLAREYRETVAKTEGWIVNAERDDERIANAKAQCDKIEDEMLTFERYAESRDSQDIAGVIRHTTPNTAAEHYVQLIVGIGQTGDLAGRRL